MKPVYILSGYKIDHESIKINGSDVKTNLVTLDFVSLPHDASLRETEEFINDIKAFIKERNKNNFYRNNRKRGRHHGKSKRIK